MNKNFTALILIVLAIGIYFTFTNTKIEELKAVRSVNADYEKAIRDSEKLIEARDKVVKELQAIPPQDLERLNRIVPDNVDNVRLIIDVKDNIAAAHGLALKDIKTSSPEVQKQTGGVVVAPPVSNTGPGVGLIAGTKQVGSTQQDLGKYGMVNLSFTVTTTYAKFKDFLRDMESSLRIMDVSKLTISTNSDTAKTGSYDFKVEVKTYWIK